MSEDQVKEIEHSFKIVNLEVRGKDCIIHCWVDSKTGNVVKFRCGILGISLNDYWKREYAGEGVKWDVAIVHATSILEREIGNE